MRTAGASRKSDGITWQLQIRQYVSFFPMQVLCKQCHRGHVIDGINVYGSRVARLYIYRNAADSTWVSLAMYAAENA